MCSVWDVCSRVLVSGLGTEESVRGLGLWVQGLVNLHVPVGGVPQCASASCASSLISTEFSN